MVPRFDYDRRIYALYRALQILLLHPLRPSSHACVCVCVHVLVRFDRTRCLQGAVAWRCRAGRSGVAKIGRGEGEDGGRGLWIDIVTGVSSGFLGGATERVSRQTFGPMYQLNPARNAFAGTIGKRRVVSTRRYPIVVESRARVCLSRSTCEFVRVLNNNNNN